MVSVNCKCIKQNKHGHSTKCFLYENEKKKNDFQDFVEPLSKKNSINFG